MKTKFKLLCGAVVLSLAGPVLAGTTWTVASNYGTISSGVTVAAYSNTGGADNISANADNQTIQTATWTNTWGGVYNADACGSATYCDANETVSPEHSIDNNQRYDMVLLNFASGVKLTGVKLGWSQTDSDITVLAYTGTGDPTATGKLTGNTYNQLVASKGWTAVGNYADVGTASPVSTGATVYSSYWLIGAYNPLAGGVSGGASPWSLGNDYVKLASVSGDICINGSGPSCTPGTPPGSVPEPGSLALVGLALMGMTGLRKRRQA